MDARLSRTELAEDDDVLYAVTERLIDEMDEELEDEPEVLAAATAGQRAVYLLFTAGAEIGSGGVRDFLESPTGRTLEATAAAADEVGAADHAAVLRAIAAVFPGGGVPADDDARIDALDLLSDEALAQLDRLEARWEAQEDVLRMRLEEHVAARPGEFFRD